MRTPGESLLAEVLTTEGSSGVSEVIVGSSSIENLEEKPRCIRHLGGVLYLIFYSSVTIFTRTIVHEVDLGLF